jgi:hypothetical protein
MKRIARAQGRRGHVAPDRDFAAHVKEPHREAAHLQTFAPKSEHDDTLRGDNGLDQSVERIFRHGREHAGEIAQRAFRQLGQGLAHRLPRLLVLA